MAIIATDLKYFKSATSSSTGNTNGRTIDSLGGAITTTELISGTLHDLFDSVSSSEAANGRVEYRCIYLKNDNATQTLYDAITWINTAAAGTNTTIEIAPDPAADDQTPAIILADEVDSTDQLTTITNWTTAPSAASSVSIGDVPSGRAKAIWIRRSITAGQAAITDSCSISFLGDTNA